MKLSFKSIAVAALLAASSIASAEIVNINEASAATMAHYLKGVGDVKAESIVKYREANGDFKSIDDLVNVKGVGKAIMKKNRSDLSLTEGVVKWVKGKPKLVVIDKDESVKVKPKSEKSLVSKIITKKALKKKGVAKVVK